MDRTFHSTTHFNQYCRLMQSAHYFAPRPSSARMPTPNVIKDDDEKLKSKQPPGEEAPSKQSMLRSMMSVKSLILLLCAALCVFQLFELLMSFFFGSRWGTTYRIEEKHEIQFPNIILCNANRVNKSKIIELGLSEENLERMLNESGLREKYPEFDMLRKTFTYSDYLNMMLFYSVHPFTFLYPHTTIPLTPTLKPQRELYNYIKTQIPGISIPKVTRTVAHTCEASILTCKYMGMVFPGFMCCKNTTLLQTELGICLNHSPMTMSPLPMQAMSGITGGYNLMYNLNKLQYVSTVIDNHPDDGLFVYFSYGDEYVSPIAIQSGSHSFISLTSTRSELDESGLSLFSPPCEKRQLTAQLQRPYSHQKCREDCQFTLMAKICKCMPALSHNNISQCEPDAIEDCIFAKLREEYVKAKTSGNGHNMLTACEEKCAPACNRNYVENSISSTKFPGESKIPKIIDLTSHFLGSSVTANFLETNLIVLDVYFDQLSQVVVELYPKATVEQLVGNIGGQIGLWLGASILTIYEALVGVAICFKCRKKTSAEVMPPANKVYY